MNYGCGVSCQRPLPAVYDDSLSYYEQLCKMHTELKKVLNEIEVNSEEIEKIKEAVAKFGELLDSWAAGKFDDVIEKEVIKWVEDNVTLIFDTYCKQVFFGLTDDGYFCAYIPKSWSEISFDTGMNFGTEEYGRLILRFFASGSGVINNQ